MGAHPPGFYEVHFVSADKDAILLPGHPWLENLPRGCVRMWCTMRDVPVEHFVGEFFVICDDERDDLLNFLDRATTAALLKQSKGVA